MYCCMYAVARYSRAVEKLGSSSTAFLKLSTASAYCALLNACTPLFSLSRDCSCLQPALSRATAARLRMRMGLRITFLPPRLSSSDRPYRFPHRARYRSRWRLRETPDPDQL